MKLDSSIMKGDHTLELARYVTTHLAAQHEEAIRVAIGTVLLKLGETSIEITHEDVERVSNREIKIEQGRNGSCVLKIV